MLNFDDTEDEQTTVVHPPGSPSVRVGGVLPPKPLNGGGQSPDFACPAVDWSHAYNVGNGHVEQEDSDNFISPSTNGRPSNPEALQGGSHLSRASLPPLTGIRSFTDLNEDDDYFMSSNQNPAAGGRRSRKKHRRRHNYDSDDEDMMYDDFDDHGEYNHHHHNQREFFNEDDHDCMASTMMSPSLPPPATGFSRVCSEMDPNVHSCDLPISVRWAVGTSRGVRSKQEDTFTLHPDLKIPDGPAVQLCGVYDGHGGTTASEALSSTFAEHLQHSAHFGADMPQAMVDAIRHVDETLRTYKSQQTQSCGSTVCVAAIEEDILTIANLGDSRAIIANREGAALQVTDDHKPGSHPVERHRLTKLKALKHDRVNGELAVSRAVGDFSYKGSETADASKMAVSNMADTHQLQIHDDLNFMVLATDGLWDVMSPQDVADFIMRSFEEEECPPQLTQESAVCTQADGEGCYDMATPRNPLQAVADALVAHSVSECKSNDNVTAIIVTFH